MNPFKYRSFRLTDTRTPYDIKPCVYFMELDGEIIYVGQTMFPADRMAEHRSQGRKPRPKDITVYYRQVHPDRLCSVEIRAIRQFRPVLNVVHNPECKSKKWNSSRLAKQAKKKEQS